MARFELPIYGPDDEMVRKYETDHVRWGTLIEVVGLAEKTKGLTGDEQIAAFGSIMKLIFPDLTDEDLANADCLDIVSTFTQVANVIGGIKAGEAKNG